jgi:hypothetical protein
MEKADSFFALGDWIERRRFLLTVWQPRHSNIVVAGSSHYDLRDSAVDFVFRNTDHHLPPQSSLLWQLQAMPLLRKAN